MNSDSQEPDEPSSYYIKPQPRPRLVNLVLDWWHTFTVRLSPSSFLKPKSHPLIQRPRPITLDMFPLGVNVILGVLTPFALNIVVFKLCQLIPPLRAFGLLFGIMQFLYMMPIIWHFRERNNRGMVIGLIIGVSLNALLGLPFIGAIILCAVSR